MEHIILNYFSYIKQVLFIQQVCFDRFIYSKLKKSPNQMCSLFGLSQFYKCTHLDFNILAVDHLHNTDNIIKNKAQFLAVVCRESDMVTKNEFFCSAHPQAQK